MTEPASPALASISLANRAAIEDAAVLIRKAERAVVLTGAGISTPSGIPDFRSEGTGLWSRDEPLEVASLTSFRTAPERFFQWFQPLASRIFNAQPNPAHLALAEFERGIIRERTTAGLRVARERGRGGRKAACTFSKGSSSSQPAHAYIGCQKCYPSPGSRIPNLFSL